MASIYIVRVSRGLKLKFLEYSVPAEDVYASLRWYTALGFSELPVGEVRRHHYAVVSDGQFCIGLHGNNSMGPALSFVRPELAAYVREQQATGRLFDFARTGPDEFHEAGIADPDGTLALLLEARSFASVPDAGSELPLIGQLQHLMLPCSSLPNSLHFWQDFGFITVQPDGTEYAELHAPGLTLVMRESARQATLAFRSPNIADCLERLAAQGTVPRRVPEGLLLTSPEASRLLLLAD